MTTESTLRQHCAILTNYPQINVNVTKKNDSRFSKIFATAMLVIMARWRRSLRSFCVVVGLLFVACRFTTYTDMLYY